MNEIPLLFKKLSSIATPDGITDDEFELLELFVVRLCSKTCNTNEVNEARRILFSKNNKVIKNIPPTKEALRPQVLGSAFQSSFCKDFDGEDACQWVLAKSRKRNVPLWTHLPQASILCRELVKCGCKKGYTGRCKFLTSDLKCT